MDLQHVVIRNTDKMLLGEQVEGTRLWQRRGCGREVMSWFEAILGVCQYGVVPAGFAAHYVEVTTQTVRARIKTGRLTAFDFTVGDNLGRYRFVPFCELEEWRRTRMKWKAARMMRRVRRREVKKKT